MSKGLLMQRTGILLILLVTCSPIICQSTNNNPLANAQNKPSSQNNPPKASDDLKVDPAIFGLKELLYCDKKLSECVSDIPQSYKLRTDPLLNKQLLKDSDLSNEDYGHIAEAVLLTQKGEPKQAVAILESNTNGKIKQEFGYWMALAYAKQQLGDLIGARHSLRQILTLPDMETGIQLQVWSMLRELGDKPEEQIANQVLGVVIEVGVANTVVVVAGFADGMSRLWFVTGGGGPIGGKENFPKESIIAAKNMVSAAQPLVSAFPIEKDRQLPKQGRMRFALLTAGGIHVKEVSINQLDNRKAPLLYSLNSASHDLFTILLKFNLEQGKTH